MTDALLKLIATDDDDDAEGKKGTIIITITVTTSHLIPLLYWIS